MNLKTNKRAILVVSFGTSYIDTMEKTITAIENEIQNVIQYIVLLLVKLL